MAHAPIKKSAVKKLADAKTKPVEQQATTVSNTLAAELAVAHDVRVEKMALIVRDCETADEFLREINLLWGQSKARFLLIGQYLIAAKAKLGHGQFEDFVERQLPFSAPTARQLRAVAEAVFVDHRVTEVEIPSSYSIAYQLVTMKDEVLAQARERGLISENVTRSEIISFKKEVQPPKEAVNSRKPTKQPSEKDLLTEKDRLLARIAEIDAILLKDEGLLDLKSTRH